MKGEEQVEIKHSRTSVYALEYHLVFCTKYRRKVLIEDICKDLLAIIDDISKKHKTYSIESANGEEDHVHLLVSTNPRQDLPTMVKHLKGSSAFRNGLRPFLPSLARLTPSLKKGVPGRIS